MNAFMLLLSGVIAMGKLIAIVDDEEDIVELVSLHLKKNGFSAKEFHEAGPFLRFLRSNIPDLIVLDLMLPDMDGFEICKLLKKEDRLSRIPIIMLSARSNETDKVLGLELGADDYVTKPFSPKELIARIKAALRKTTQKETSATIEAGDLIIDRDRFSVLAGRKNVDLTTTEFKILELLASRKGWVFPREKILDSLWGDEKIVTDRTIDVHIKNLREKLGPAGKIIKNIRGIGYKIEE